MSNIKQQEHECIQIAKITMLESNLANMEKIQNILLKTTITIVSGLLIEGFSILVVYLLNQGGK